MIIAELHIFCESPSKRHYATLQKEFKTELVPMVSMQFEDIGLKGRPIKQVTINPTAGHYHLYVGADTRADKSQCEKLQRVYEAHGCKLPRDLFDGLGADEKE